MFQGSSISPVGFTPVYTINLPILSTSRVHFTCCSHLPSGFQVFSFIHCAVDDVVPGYASKEGNAGHGPLLPGLARVQEVHTCVLDIQASLARAASAPRLPSAPPSAAATGSLRDGGTDNRGGASQPAAPRQVREARPAAWRPE